MEIDAVPVELGQITPQQHVVQWPQLHRRAVELQAIAQPGVPPPGQQHNHLWLQRLGQPRPRRMQVHLPDPPRPKGLELHFGLGIDPHNRFGQRFGKSLDERGGIEHLLVHAVNRTGAAPEQLGHLRRRDRFGGHLEPHLGSQQAQLRASRLSSPEVESLCRDLHLGKIGISLTLEALPPEGGHFAGLAGGGGQDPREGVLEPAMENTLRGNGLSGSQAKAFDQKRLAARLTQGGEGPETGDSAANHKYIERYAGHGFTTTRGASLPGGGGEG